MTTIAFCAGAPNPAVEQLKNYTFDILVGVDGGSEQLINAGYTLDWAIGDFDSINVPHAKQVMILPREKDDTDLQYAINHILHQIDPQQISKIIILGGLGGGRLDHTIGNIYFAYDKRFREVLSKIEFIEQKNTLTYYLPGEYTVYKTKLSQYVSFIPMTPITALTLKRVKYPLYKQNYECPIALISNEFITDSMEVSFEQGILAVLQTRD